MTSNSPISQNQRTPIIDILRGWALFSVVIMNYSTIYGWNTHSDKSAPDRVTSFLETFTEIIFGSKGWTLLAVLFGFGFSALLNKIGEEEQSTYFFFIKRMLWLFVFAFINTLFFGGDILNDYAFLGILLLLFYKLGTRNLFIIGIAVLMLTPLLQSYLGRLHLLFAPKDRDAFYGIYNRHTLVDHLKANLFMRYKWLLRFSYLIIFHLVQLGCLLIGAALHRSKFFLQIDLHKNLLIKVFFTSLGVAVALYYLQVLIEKKEWNFNQYYNLYYIQILCIMITSSTGIIWLYIVGKGKRVFNGLQAVGKMTLTNYITQNIIAFGILICYKPAWALHWYLLFGCAIYIAQIFLSKYWLKKFQYGPLEWLWRCLSYQRMIQLKKSE